MKTVYISIRLASLAIACRGARLCGRPFSVSEDASWPLVRDEYLWHGSVAETTIAGGTEKDANAPKEVMSKLDGHASTNGAPGGPAGRH